MSAAGYPHSLGEASHRLRAKWGAILAFGLLLMLLGALSLVFVFVLDPGDGDAERRVVRRRRRRGDRHRDARAQLGPVLLLGDRRRASTSPPGSFCILYPLAASAMLTLFIGAGLIAAAAVRAYLAFQLPAEPAPDGGLARLRGDVSARPRPSS